MLHPDDLPADFETRSRVDLKKAGARRYAADPSTGITSVVWQFRGIRKRACPVHPHLGTHTLADLYADIRLCRRFVAHHANFDVSILRAVNPFLDLPLSKIDCTMGRAQALALPGGLDQVCRALGIRGKDPRGRELVMKTCRPQRDGTFNEDVQTFRELLEYNDVDVDCLIDLDGRLPPLTPDERLIFERTWRKNEIGLPIDVHLATAIAMRRQEIEQESTATLMELTQNAVTKLSQRQRIVEWCNSGNRAAGLESTQKHTVAEKLADENLHPDVRIVLELLLAEGGSAPLKAQALLDRHVNGFYKDATRYFGARSGRGTSEGANMFNIARPSGKYDGEDGRPTIDSVIQGLKAGFKYNNIALTDCLRSTIVAPQGWMVCDNDLSGAEYRLAMWMAGDTERLTVLATGDNPYIYNATKMGGWPEGWTKKNHLKEYTIYKNVTLGGNYQLGWKTFLAHMRKGGINIDEVKARSSIDGYRQANPLLVSLWYALADAFKFAIYEQPGRIFPAGKVAFQKDSHGTVWMLLPSGRAVPHYSAHITYGGEMAFFRGKFGAMLRQRAFGGSLLEIACLSGVTEVLTTRGRVRIVDVRRTDKVWDGTQWVRHRGLVCRGEKETVLVEGFRATSDHLTMYAENQWCGIAHMGRSQLQLALSLARSQLPGSSKTASDLAGLSSQSANAAPMNTFFNPKICAVGIVRNVLNVLTQQLLGECKSILPSTGACGPALLISSADVQNRQTKAGTTTVVVASQYTPRGWQKAAGNCFLSTYSRCQGMTTLVWTSIVSKMKKVTNRATCGSVRAVSTPATNDRYETTKRRELVYDLLDCGPLNRFTICSPQGRFLLVHNCQSMTRDIVTAAEADIERELPDVVLILDVYDSILSLARTEVADVRSQQMREIMKRPRSWTSGLPLDCEGYESERMRK
jgi:hypothetical protein